jgi:hypothetical protein
LCAITAELEELKTRVTLISFGITEIASRWLVETNANFQFLIDPPRMANRTYGLEHSLARSRSPKVWVEYAWLMTRGRKWRDIQDDSGQLGGDFIVDRESILRLAYRSYNPTDGPAMSVLLDKLDDINGYYMDKANLLTI